MMDTSGTTSPEGVEARWAENQMGTLLLHDSNNFKYQIHQKNLDWTKATQRCVKLEFVKIFGHCGPSHGFIIHHFSRS
jgi:hypothetical protein